MRLLPLLLLTACAGSQAAGAGVSAGSETLRTTGVFIKSCLEQPAWAAAFAKKKGANPKVQLAPLTDKAGGSDTNAMLTAMERTLLAGTDVDVLPWGDALLGMASYQSDAMALGGTESSVSTDPDFIVGGRIERIADGNTVTLLSVMNSDGEVVCKAPRSSSRRRCSWPRRLAPPRSIG